MNRIAGRRALVTGASAGFGRACARLFAENGVHVVLWARREDRLNVLRDEIVATGGVDVRCDPVDVRDREAVLSAGERLRGDGTEPDILVNNAGLAAGLGKLHEGDYDDWDRMIDTNLKGLLNVTRCFLPGMVERDCGHVINIGSVAGHVAYPKGNVYNATKFAVRGLSEALNLDLVGTRVRVSSVDPGAARTEFSTIRFHGDAERADAVYRGFDPLEAEDIAEAVWFVANAPEHVNVTDMVIMPTAQRNPFVLHRRDA